MSELKVPIVNDKFLYYLDVCARCGACSEACHFYRVTRDPVHAPAYRMELFRRLYRKQKTLAGRLFPSLFKTKGVGTEEFLEEFRRAAFECTGCRRCAVFCPLGIDMGAFVGPMRAALYDVGLGYETLDLLADTAISKGEMIDELRQTFVQTIRDIERKVREGTHDSSFRIPIGVKKADFMYVALTGEHTIIPAAKIFNAAGENWTLSLFEASNYGYFTGQIGKAKRIVKRVIDEARELDIDTLVIAECGHAYRVFKRLAPLWFEDFDFEVKSIVEVVAEYIDEDRIRVRPEAIRDPVTYHDPCQLARNGGVIEEPREALKVVCKDFRELKPNREENWCCGGGGGLVAIPELYGLRMKVGKLKAEQIRESGAKIVATACENCKLQLSDLADHYGLDIKIVGVIDLVAGALEAEEGNL